MTSQQFYPAHVRLWAECPPFTKVYVTPHIAHSGPVYLGPDDSLVQTGFADIGLYVGTEQQKRDIEAMEAGGV